MSEKQKNVMQEEDIAKALLENTQEIAASQEASEKEVKTEDAETDEKTFRKYKIKDIVFLAIMSACMLVTGAIMPLVGQIPLFGIVQLCLGLQFSVFPVIGMMKVRKAGALVFMSLCCGVLLVFMSPVMFFSILLCALIAEALTGVIFRSYKRDGACLFAGTIYFPCSLPFLYVYYNFLYTVTSESGEAVSAFVGASPAVAIGMSAAVLAVCFVGALVGMLVSRELRKSGVMKK